MNTKPAIEIIDLDLSYGGVQALRKVAFSVFDGRDFRPAGSQRKWQDFAVSSADNSVVADVRVRSRYLVKTSNESPASVRRVAGVVFQSQSLDRKLTVIENLRHQGHLYGLSGAELRQRTAELLERFGLTERGSDIVETLSGGMRRRVELAKSILHRPRLLLLDEPSTWVGSRRPPRVLAIPWRL